MFKGVKVDSFHNHFPSEEASLQYLSDFKWQQGYRCKKCGGQLWWKGKRMFDGRCQECNYNESQQQAACSTN
ncbi:transposase [[Flexibacter] sp. ATCC 35208]|uniref:transposase n=1 Tax=unclassified Chitinophaga TaxID=2619133 RepID=UPI001C6FCE4B